MASDATPLDQKPNAQQWALLVLILIVATILRFIFIGKNEAHIDELWHLELSTGRGTAHQTLPMNVLIPQLPRLTSLQNAPTWQAIWTSLDDDAHPPLYYLTLRLWREIFGESITAGRSLAAVLSVFCVLMFFDVTRLLHGPAAALWACLILAASSAQIATAQEIRHYAMLTFFCLAAADSLLRIEKLGYTNRRAAMLCITLLLAFFTNYFAAPVAATLTIYTLCRLRGPTLWKTLAAVVIAGVIYGIVWCPMMYRQAKTFAAAAVGPLHENVPNHVSMTFLRASIDPVRQLFEPWPSNLATSFLSATIFFIPWLMLRKQRELLLWIMWLTITVGFTLSLDLLHGTRQLDDIRYTILAGPAVCALLPAMFQRQRAIIRHGAAATVALACIAALGLSYSRYAPRFSAMGPLLAGADHADAPLIFYSDENNPDAANWMLLAAAQYSSTFPRPVVRLHEPADAQLLQELHRWPRICLAWCFTDKTAEQILPGGHVIWHRGEPRVGDVAVMEWSNP